MVFSREYIEELLEQIGCEVEGVIEDKPEEMRKLIAIAIDCGVQKNPELFNLVFDRIYPNKIEGVSGIVDKAVGSFLDILKRSEE